MEYVQLILRLVANILVLISFLIVPKKKVFDITAFVISITGLVVDLTLKGVGQANRVSFYLILVFVVLRLGQIIYDKLKS